MENICYIFKTPVNHCSELHHVEKRQDVVEGALAAWHEEAWSWDAFNGIQDRSEEQFCANAPYEEAELRSFPMVLVEATKKLGVKEDVAQALA